nr:triple gene block 3 [Hydrangea ringspot virus]
MPPSLSSHSWPSSTSLAVFTAALVLTFLALALLTPPPPKCFIRVSGAEAILSGDCSTLSPEALRHLKPHSHRC